MHKLLSQKMRQGQLMSLQQYFSYDRKSWRNQDQNTMYAMAWAVTYFLMDSRQGKEQLSRFMQELTRDRCQSLNTAKYFEGNYRGGGERVGSGLAALVGAGPTNCSSVLRCLFVGVETH